MVLLVVVISYYSMYAILNSKYLKRHTNLTERQLNKKAIAVVRGSLSTLKTHIFSVVLRTTRL